MGPKPRQGGRGGSAELRLEVQEAALELAEEAPPPSAEWRRPRRPARARTAPDLRAWRARAVALMALLEAHGAAEHAVRADVARGLFLWLDREGRISASARCVVLGRWSPLSAALTLREEAPQGAVSSEASQVPAGLDEDQAFQWAMLAAEARGQEFLYRLFEGEDSIFLGLSLPVFEPPRSSLAPSSSAPPAPPVDGILADLASLRRSLASAGSPLASTPAASLDGSLDGICSRLSSLGALLCERARSTYGGSDWVARLERSGRRLERLAESWAVPRELCLLRSRAADKGASPAAAGELDRALQHLEDEWRAFVGRQRA